MVSTKSYYKKFSLQLIEQVRLRPLIYDTKEPRSKQDKQAAWKDVAEVLNSDYPTCRKHWKNVRDRFVKVQRARDKHFNSGGNELKAPSYIFYDKLSFMTDHSISKDLNCSQDRTNRFMDLQDLAPELLLAYPKSCKLENYEGTENPLCIDMTESFINEVKKYPILYDKDAELRKFRSPEVWRKILLALEETYMPDCKATMATLRSFWVGLMKKYKLFIKHEASGQYQAGQIENESYFDLLSFVEGEDYQRKNIQFVRVDSDFNDEEETEIMYLEEQENQYEDEFSTEDQEDLADQEYQAENEESEEFVKYEIEELNQTEDHVTSEDEVETISKIEDTKDEVITTNPPSLKRIKLSEDFKIVFPPVINTNSKANQVLPNQVEDEFDHFGKKIAAQLREICQKNRLIARKAEISVMQLLMDIEESLES
ncbi:unnamed protein product [Diamesa serratosioi]